MDGAACGGLTLPPTDLLSSASSVALAESLKLGGAGSELSAKDLLAQFNAGTLSSLIADADAALLTSLNQPTGKDDDDEDEDEGGDALMAPPAALSSFGFGGFGGLGGLDASPFGPGGFSPLPPVGPAEADAAVMAATAGGGAGLPLPGGVYLPQMPRAGEAPVPSPTLPVLAAGGVAPAGFARDVEAGVVGVGGAADDDVHGLVTLFPKSAPSAGASAGRGGATAAERGPGSVGAVGSVGSLLGGTPASAAALATGGAGWAGSDSSFFDSLSVRRSHSRIDAGGYSSRSRSTTLDSWASGSGPRGGGIGSTPLVGSAAVSLSLLPPGELDAGTLLRRSAAEVGLPGGGLSIGGPGGGGASVGEFLPPLGASASRGGALGGGPPSGLLLPQSPGAPPPAASGGVGAPLGGGGAAAGGGLGVAASRGGRPGAGGGASVEAPAGWPTWPDPSLTDSYDGTATRPGAGLGINWEPPDTMLL